MSATEEEFATLHAVEPVYPLTAGLTPKVMAKAVAGAAGARARSCPSGRMPPTCKQRGWPDWRAGARRPPTRPRDQADLDHHAACRASGWPIDELLANQLALALVRASQKRARGRAAGRRRPPARRSPSTPCPSRSPASQNTAIERDPGRHGGR